MVKQLKSTHQDLSELFDREIKTKHIAERLKCCSNEENSAKLREEMERIDFDVMGIGKDGETVGYVERIELRTGPAKNFKKNFFHHNLWKNQNSFLLLYRHCVIVEGSLLPDKDMWQE